MKQPKNRNIYEFIDGESYLFVVNFVVFVCILFIVNDQMEEKEEKKNFYINLYHCLP